MIAFKEVVIVFNGPLTGLNKSLIDYFNQLRKELIQPKIKIFIQSWEYENNLLIFKDLKQYIKTSNYDRLELLLDVETYNSKGLTSACRQLNDGIGYTQNDIPSLLGKRMWFFYSLLKVLQRVQKYNPDAFVMRFEPNTKWIKDSDRPVNIPLWIATGSTKTPIRHYNMGGELRRRIQPSGANTDPTDMYYTNIIHEKSVGERYFWSSVKSFENMFVDNFNITNFVSKYIDILKTYLDASSVKIKLENKSNVYNTFYDYDIVPHHAAQYLYKFIESSKEYIPVVPLLKPFDAMFKDERCYSNPWLDVSEDNVLSVDIEMKRNTYNEIDWSDQIHRPQNEVI